MLPLMDCGVCGVLGRWHLIGATGPLFPGCGSAMDWPDCDIISIWKANDGPCIREPRSMAERRVGARNA
jgi:hypothetical protein